MKYYKLLAILQTLLAVAAITININKITIVLPWIMATTWAWAWVMAVVASERWKEAFMTKGQLDEH